MIHQGQPEQEIVDRPDVLPEGTTMERRADGSVWQITKAIPAHDDDGKEKPGPDFLSFRVDSVKDVDLVAKGGEPWYFKFIGESVPGRKAQGVDPAVAQLIVDMTARLDKAEARADAADNRAEAFAAIADAAESRTDVSEDEKTPAEVHAELRATLDPLAFAESVVKSTGEGVQTPAATPAAVDAVAEIEVQSPPIVSRKVKLPGGKKRSKK